MSIKTNTTDLQALLEVANSLPTAENLDTELSTQDDLIAQITAALEGKMVPSVEPEVISITVSSESATSVYYHDVSGVIKSASGNTTFEALNGIVFYYGSYELQATGDYTASSVYQYQSVKFNSAGGIVMVSPFDGSN